MHKSKKSKVVVWQLKTKSISIERCSAMLEVLTRTGKGYAQKSHLVTNAIVFYIDCLY